MYFLHLRLYKLDFVILVDVATYDGLRIFEYRIVQGFIDAVKLVVVVVVFILFITFVTQIAYLPPPPHRVQRTVGQRRVYRKFLLFFASSISTPLFPTQIAINSLYGRNIIL